MGRLNNGDVRLVTTPLKRCRGVTLVGVARRPSQEGMDMRRLILVGRLVESSWNHPRSVLIVVRSNVMRDLVLLVLLWDRCSFVFVERRINRRDVWIRIMKGVGAVDNVVGMLCLVESIFVIGLAIRCFVALVR
jgi:hypothetical protein